MAKSITPQKPYPTFLLAAHPNGQWCKTIRCKLHYFGPWDDPDGALKRHHTMAAGLHAGRAPKASLPAAGLTIKEICNAYLEAWRPRAIASEVPGKGRRADSPRERPHPTSHEVGSQCPSDRDYGSAPWGHSGLVFVRFRGPDLLPSAEPGTLFSTEPGCLGGSMPCPTGNEVDWMSPLMSRFPQRILRLWTPPVQA
jgi:hypothetical protein